MNNAFAFFAKAGICVLLAAAVASCNNQGTKPTAATVGGDSTQANIEKIVYVNADTLLEKYEYFKDIRVKLEEKAKKAQADLQSRSNAFQREVADYQQKAPTMSAADRQSTEERLARKQDELARHNQNASASFAQEEASENEKLYSRITEYLKKHAKENGYKLVLTYSTSNPAVLYADESLEITDEVLAALNSEYAKEKK
ncbi:OmpH family outer membrane protein [Parapedobacter indicus]|uniref:Periplasmic chaperone for outer membrane proteins Skp n=1 Tax=Parapedobacter indicus TaxID=1477437 RepID=A0A1I3RKW7_9SPHI|nr:OmpH family outer membrane protein [Parapedobacter indicus]PPL00067.1 periplasmic chaperone for outer membrane proteins Skp [Parapedobacter indicus]SFJ47254.1 periplasmic chaperone for outer membrane proteins Skp [Parapedobacter indicus]